MGTETNKNTGRLFPWDSLNSWTIKSVQVEKVNEDRRISNEHVIEQETIGDSYMERNWWKNNFENHFLFFKNNYFLKKPKK